MSKDEDNKEYKGPGKFTAAIGRGTVEGTLTGIAGAAIGAGVGALTRSKVAGEEAMHAATQVEKKFLNIIPVAGGALIGESIGGVAGFIHGAYRGAKNVGNTKRQVEDLNAQIDSLGTQIEQQKSFTQALATERQTTAETAKDPSGKGGR